VLALQELTPSSMATLRPALVAAGYRPPFEQRELRPFNGHEHYHVALTTRAPLGPLVEARYREYSATRMGRGLLLGRAEWPGVGTVVLSSTHLESWIGKEEEMKVRADRKSQVREAAAWLRREAEQHGAAAAVLVGDTNWDDKDGDPLREMGAGWVDTWEAVGKPAAAKATCWWNRLDRCFVLSLRGGGVGQKLGAMDAWLASSGRAANAGGSSDGRGEAAAVTVSSVTLVGQDIPGEMMLDRRGKTKPLPVSDHKGLLVALDAAAR